MATLPGSGISTSLVKQTLGAETNDVGRLCIHPNVNKWSKYKPVSYASITTDGDPNWWKGKTGTCGFFLPSIRDPADIDSYTFEYIPPSGGASSPYRLGDFRGYNHDAVNPVNFIYPERLYNNTGQDFFTVDILNDDNALSIYDIYNNLNGDVWYFGIMLSNGTNKRYRTSEAIALPSICIIDIGIANDGNLSVYRNSSMIKATPFLANVPLETWSIGYTSFVKFETLVDYKTIEIPIIQYNPPKIFEFAGDMRLMNVAKATGSVDVKNVSNIPQVFRWDMIQYDKSDSEGAFYKNLKAKFTRTLNGDELGSETIQPNASSHGVFSISGSNKVVDSYSLTCDFRYYDAAFGYRQMISLAAFYSGSGGDGGHEPGT